MKIFNTYGCVDLTSSASLQSYPGVPEEYHTDDVNACNGVTEISITVSGDEPELAFLRVEGLDQESTDAMWTQLADSLVSISGWWRP